MTSERRTYPYCCLVVLVLQTAAHSLPIAKPEARSDQLDLRQCLTVRTGPGAVKPTPRNIVDLLGQHQAQDFVLPLPVTEGDAVDEKLIFHEGAASVLCQGVWPHMPFLQETIEKLQAVYFTDSLVERGEYHAVSCASML